MASLLAVGALSVGAIAAGCGDDDSGGGDVGELKVGVLVPLTGDLADFGGPGSKAADLAAAQVNAAAEAGDTGLQPDPRHRRTPRPTRRRPQEAATKLIESDGVSAIAGPWGTPELIPTAENVTIPAGIPIVTPSATGPDLTDLDDDGLVFRTPPSDAIQGQLIAQIMGEAIGAGRDGHHRQPQRRLRHGARGVVHRGLGGERRHGRQERPVQPARRRASTPRPSRSPAATRTAG